MSAALGANFFAELLFLVGIALAVYAIELNRVVQRDQLERGHLGRELAEAKLDALMLQLEPHFLFNTLNSAVSLIGRSPRAAEDMITDLSGILQATLRPGSREVPLSAELEQVDAYLRIMRHRFGERLTVHIDVDAPARSALVPRFLLQPLVENAIEHGFNESDGVGNIIIRGGVQGSTLTLAVLDNGDGFPAHTNGSVSSEGIGLANTRRRLAQMYGEDCTLTISSKPGGTAVAITLPRRTQMGVTA